MRRGRIRIAALAALSLAVLPAVAPLRPALAREVSRVPLEAGAPAIRANGRVNVRAEPSTSAPVVATVAPGTVFESPGVVTGRPWVAVSRDGRLFGYVFAELVSSMPPAPAPVPASTPEPAPVAKAAEVPAVTIPAVTTATGEAQAVDAINDRLRAVEQALSGMRTDLDRQAQLSREGFERTERLLSGIQAQLPEPDRPTVVRLHPPPTRLDVAIESVRGLIARMIGN
jgi:hypothetical protein